MILDIVFDICHIRRLKAYACEPFVCPNCGERFTVKWYKLLINREATIVMCGKAKLKCPKCKEIDMCRWTGESL